MSKNKSADITPANPLVITIDETSTNETVSGGVSCRSHAAYIQQVSVEIKDSNGTLVTGVFQGAGENVSMPLLGGGKVLSFSELEAPVDVSLLFAYSSNNGVSFQNNSSNEVFPSIGYKDPTIEIYNVTTEDAVDSDDNDTYLTLAVHRHTS